MDDLGFDRVSFVLAIAFHVVLTIIGLWDLYTWYFLPPGHSVSAVIQRWSDQFPAMLLFVGFMFGHLFWPLRVKREG